MILTSFWHERPRLINNPVIKRELTERLRKPSSFIYLFLFLGILSFFLITEWSSYRTGNYYDYRARNLFYMFSLFQACALFFLIPILSSTSINLEFTCNTWDLLRTTHLNSASIVLAKFISSITYIALLFLALIPFYGLLFLMGSTAPSEIIVTYAVMAEGVIICGFCGLLASTLFSKPVQSISAAYLFSALYIIGPMFCTIYFDSQFRSSFLWGIPLVLSPFYPIILYMDGPPPRNIVSPMIQANGIPFHFALNAILLFFLIWLCLYLVARKSKVKTSNRKITFIRSFGFREYFRKRNLIIEHETLSIPERSNPVYHREKCEMESNNRLSNYFYTGILFFTSVLWLYHHYSHRFGMPNSHALQIWPIAFLTPLFVIPYAVNTFRNEKDRGTWDLLQTTLLQHRQVVWGKFLEGMRLFTWRISSLCLLIVIMSATAYLDIKPDLLHRILYDRTNHFDWILGIILLSFVWAAFYIGWGMYFSASSKNTTNAYIKMIVFMIAIISLPYFLPVYERSFFSPYNAYGMEWLSPFINTASTLSPLYHINFYNDLSSHGDLGFPGTRWIKLTLLQALWMGLTTACALCMTWVRIKRKE